MPLAMSSGTPSWPIGCRDIACRTHRVDIVAAEIARPADKGLLAQVQHVPLHHAAPGDPRVLDNALVAMLLAILPAVLVAQENGGRA
jgi:hypothetical protein